MDEKDGNPKGETQQVDIGVEYEMVQDSLKDEEKKYGKEDQEDVGSKSDGEGPFFFDLFIGMPEVTSQAQNDEKQKKRGEKNVCRGFSEIHEGKEA